MSTRSFDPEDRDSWYFGSIGRDETNIILDKAKNSGVFLVRDSSTIPGDLVLCVREDSKTSHYIINKRDEHGKVKYCIGDQTFESMPYLLTFYKLHYLDTTPLIEPAPREQVVAKFDFPGKDNEDLPFKKGEVLTVLVRDEDQWWTARNAAGKKGSIPVPYVVKYDSQDHEKLKQQQHVQQQQQQQQIYKRPESQATTPAAGSMQRKLPAMARVIQSRVPSAYDRTLLKLEVGDIVKVIDMPINGQWKGIINGKEGLFPFTHVKFIDEEGGSGDS